MFRTKVLSNVSFTIKTKSIRITFWYQLGDKKGRLMDVSKSIWILGVVVVVVVQIYCSCGSICRNWVCVDEILPLDASLWWRNWDSIETCLTSSILSITLNFPFLWEERNQQNNPKTNDKLEVYYIFKHLFKQEIPTTVDPSI